MTLIALIAASIAVAMPTIGAEATTGAQSCRAGDVIATIEGQRVCLRVGSACATGLDRTYHRFGFHCHSGGLVRDDLLVLARRPLRTPKLPQGSECPITTSSGPISRLRVGLNGETFGTGPAYPLFYGPPARQADRQPILAIGQGTYDAAGWLSGKVLWVLDRRYRGNALLIRGRDVRFQGGAARRLVLRGGSLQPSQVSVRAPGCYALQIDGVAFPSRTVVFEAV